MHGCIVIVLAVHIYIYIYKIYDKTRILLNPFVGLLLGCKSSYTCKVCNDHSVYLLQSEHKEH